jgi:putative lipase involved disintegration of autophagic bodies
VIDTDSADKTFSVTGHSLGGGIAQAIAYTFGLNGVTLDLMNYQDFRAFVASIH